MVNGATRATSDNRTIGEMHVVVRGITSYDTFTVFLFGGCGVLLINTPLLEKRVVSHD
jgi:hypothetical protein